MTLIDFKQGLHLSVYGLIAISIIISCSNDYLGPEEVDTPQGAVLRLNKNINGLRGIANACSSADSIAVFNIKYNDDGSVLYWFCMKEGGDYELYSEIVSQEFRVPELSMVKEGRDFYWSIDGWVITDSKGEKVTVTDLSKPISFLLKDGAIHCKVKNSIIGDYPITKVEYLAKDVAFDYDVDKREFNLRLSSGYMTSFPTISSFCLLETSVPNRSYYKDVFLDAGIALTSRKSLAAAEFLGLSLEGISLPYSGYNNNDRTLQTAIVSGDSKDLNGRLLYPDGQPRYRLLFVNGGASTTHGQSLGKKGVNTIRTFVENGGCYIGTCAGAFLASNGYDSKIDYPYYFSIWPGIMQHTGLSHTQSGMFIEQDSPLLQYFDFGGDYYVDSIRHNGGGFPLDLPIGTEVLARYDYPKKKSVHNQPSIWAYKASPKSGRVIQEGSHPEEVLDGERRDLTAAMMLYAMEGGGVVSLKGFLRNGEERVMDKKTTDNDPAFTRIGDLQTHHFAAYIPSNAKNILVEVNSSSDCDIALMMSQATYAFLDTAEYRSCSSGPKQKLVFSHIREGLWFIAVQCLTTVNVEETEYGQAYSGKTEVLNGIPYRVSISWE